MPSVREDLMSSQSAKPVTSRIVAIRNRGRKQEQEAALDAGGPRGYTPPSEALVSIKRRADAAPAASLPAGPRTSPPSSIVGLPAITGLAVPPVSPPSSGSFPGVTSHPAVNPPVSPPVSPPTYRPPVVSPPTGGGGGTVSPPTSGGSTSTPSTPPTPATATPGPGILGKVMFRLGFVPKGEIAPLTTEAAQLQGQVGALTTNNATLLAQATQLEAQIGSARASVASLTSQQNSLMSQLQSLLSQTTSLTSKLNGLKAQLASLQSQLSGLQADDATLTSEIAAIKNAITADTATLTGLQGQWKALLATLQGDTSTINGLRGNLGNLQSQVQSYGDISAAPRLTSGPNQTGDDVQGGPNDPGFGPYDPAFSGFAPYTASFAIPSTVLAQGTGGVVADAVPSSVAYRFQSTGGYQPGQFLSGALGYVPARQITDENTQVSSLAAQLASLQSANAQLTQRVAGDQTTLAGLQSQASALSSSVATLQGEVSTATSQVSGLNSQIGSVQSQINAIAPQVSSLSSTVSSLKSQYTGLSNQDAGLQSSISTLKGEISQGTSQHQSNLALITSLQGQITTWTGYLTAIKNGEYGVSFSWSFGDGGSSTSGSTGHTYNGIGSFNPSVTITAARPDGKKVTKTFKLPGLIIGQWPNSMGYAISNSTFHLLLQDASGNGVGGARIFVRIKDVVGITMGTSVITTDSGGNASQGYYGAGHIEGRCLRNPTLDQGTDI